MFWDKISYVEILFIFIVKLFFSSTYVLIRIFLISITCIVLNFRFYKKFCMLQKQLSQYFCGWWIMNLCYHVTPMGHLRENISFMSLFVLEKPKHIERFCSNFLRCCEHMFRLTKQALPRLLVLARFCLTLLGFSDYHWL